MTQIGELVAVMVPGSDTHGSSCPFCEKSKTDGTNDLHNDAGALGSSLGKEPKYKVKTKSPGKSGMVESDSRSNAHHLIPGNASLKGHGILKFVNKGQVIESDIGYKVNAAENGVWLPTYPAEFKRYDGDTTKKIKWSAMTADYMYTQLGISALCMKQGNGQFHDAHPEYSSFVKQCLDAILEKVKVNAVSCPTEGKPKEKFKPPYGLVGRLNALSASLRAKLIPYTPKTWVEPVFTSRHAKRTHYHMMGNRSEALDLRSEEAGDE